MSPSMRVLACLTGVILWAAVLPGVASAQPTPDAQGQPEGNTTGQDAINSLAGRLPGVAQVHGMDAEELRRQFREDDTLWVDNSDRLYHIEPRALTSIAEAPPLDGPFTNADTFQLHSNAAANRVIYLDFDGHTVTGTAWNSSGPGSYVADGYSTDANPAFSNAEMAVVRSVWQRVSEDFAPFDVDVTTQDPGYAAINRNGQGDQQFGTRVVISSTSTPECSCGGVAYVGVFDETGATHDYYQPAFVYTVGVGFGAHNIAEASSHEAGHNLGLSHDGIAGGSAYYGGHGDWAPIMGVGYYQPITQWSRGEYSGATQTQDDVAVMVANGAPLAADDHGDRSTPTGLGAGPQVSADGLIHSSTDVDAFSFTAPAGRLELTISPGAVSPDLDIRAELFTSAGTRLLVQDPPSGRVDDDTARGMDATISTSLSAGTYIVTVQGTGKGNDATTGYSDYGSRGFYEIAGSLPNGETANQPPVAGSSVSITSDPSGREFLFKGGNSTDADGTVQGYLWDFGDGQSSRRRNVRHTYGAAGTYNALLTVTDDAGATDSVGITVVVDGGGSGGGGGGGGTGPDAPSDLTVRKSGQDITLTWRDNSADENEFVIRRQAYIQKAWVDDGTVVSLPANTTAAEFVSEFGKFRYIVVAVNNNGSTDSAPSGGIRVR